MAVSRYWKPTIGCNMCGRSSWVRCAGRSVRIFSTSAIRATTAIAARRASGRCGCIWSTDAAVRVIMRTMRLLIAEDDADLRQVLRELLQQSGCRRRGEGGATIHEVLYPPPYMRNPAEAAIM